MSSQITTAFVKQFGSNVQHLSQQKGSRLRNCVRVESLVGENRFFDQIGKATATRRTTRHSDTRYSDTPHARRMVTPYPYDYADLIDKPDMVRTLIDPANPYAQAAQYAMGRAMDDEILDNASASASTGVAGASSVALPSSQKIACVTSGAGSNLTVGALRGAAKILDGNEVAEEIERYIAVNALQRESLLAQTEVSNSDYNSVKALVSGQINSYMGFMFKKSERLNTQTSALAFDLTATKGYGAVATGAGAALNYQKVLAWGKDGLLLAVASDIKARVDELPGKSYSTQVFASMDIGATRMEEEMVVEILCKPT